jgi:hypothetical protein
LAKAIAAGGFRDEDFVVYHSSYFDGVRFNTAMRALIGEVLGFTHGVKINHCGYSVNIKPQWLSNQNCIVSLYSLFVRQCGRLPLCASDGAPRLSQMSPDVDSVSMWIELRREQSAKSRSEWCSESSFRN